MDHYDQVTETCNMVSRIMNGRNDSKRLMLLTDAFGFDEAYLLDMIRDLDDDELNELHQAVKEIKEGLIV